jgi:plastocyanin
MRTNGIRTRAASGAAVAAFVVVAATLLVPATASASGGGGCGGPVTDESGGEVDIVDYCFSPTILRVAPGEEVTFTNRDRAPHSVLGANATWGDYDDMKRRRGITYRFSEPGVYPYVCTYHVGMVGVVVVGDGGGGASAATTADGPVTRVPASELELENVAAATRLDPAEPEGGARPAIVAALVGSALVAGGAIVAYRRRSRRTEADASI